VLRTAETVVHINVSMFPPERPLERKSTTHTLSSCAAETVIVQEVADGMPTVLLQIIFGYTRRTQEDVRHLLGEFATHFCKIERIKINAYDVNARKEVPHGYWKVDTPLHPRCAEALPHHLLVSVMSLTCTPYQQSDLQHMLCCEASSKLPVDFWLTVQTLHEEVESSRDYENYDHSSFSPPFRQRYTKKRCYSPNYHRLYHFNTERVYHPVHLPLVEFAHDFHVDVTSQLCEMYVDSALELLAAKGIDPFNL